MEEILRHLEEAKNHIDQARKKLDGSDGGGGGGGVLGFFKEKASDIHHSLLDNSPIYRAVDGITHDIKHEVSEIDPTNPSSILGAGGSIIASSTLRTAQAVVDTVDFSETTVRLSALDDRSQNYIEAIYGQGEDSSIEYEDVRVVIGGYNTLPGSGIAPHVTGNTVYIPESYVDRDANGNYTIKQDKLDTVGHEMGHVWQNQNGGGDYMAESLIDQVEASRGGSRNDAYNGEKRLNAGVPFNDLTPEQQANVADHIGQNLDNDIVLNSEHDDAHRDILDGEGAP